MMQDQILFHSERAKEELERARRATSIMAARAHSDLSALHLEKLRALSQNSETSLAAAH